MRPVQDLVQTVRLLLDADVEGALRYINGLTHYRFTGVYFFGAEVARSWYLVDRDVLRPDPALQTIPLANTYCSIVRSSGMFRVTDALVDERLIDHPSRTAVRAYFGTPLVSPLGVNVGTLCHFDFGPVHQAGVDDELMEMLAPLVAENLVKAQGPRLTQRRTAGAVGCSRSAARA